MIVKRKWFVMVIGLIFVLLLAACSKKDSEDGESLVLSDALEEYSVWFYLYGDSNELTKDSEVHDMYVFEGDRVQQFSLDDINVTLGEVSEYSDEELITYVQEQLAAESKSYEEPEAKSYTLDILPNDPGNETMFIDLVVEDEDVLFTLWEKPLLQTIADTEFSGLIYDDDPSIEDDEIFLTRVDEPSLTILVDQPDTTKSIVTVDAWMERQKQKDLEGQDLQNVHPAELKEIENDPAAEIYAQSCLSCHGQNLEGSIGPDLTLVGDRLSEEEIKDIIQNGTGGMPPVISVDDEEADMLVKWLSEYMKE